MMYLKVNTYLRSLIIYFENVIHPASGWATDKNGAGKKKRRTKRSGSDAASPESFNIRGASKKQNKFRFNPAP
jgi:hypothetical protein